MRPATAVVVVVLAASTAVVGTALKLSASPPRKGRRPARSPAPEEPVSHARSQTWSPAPIPEPEALPSAEAPLEEDIAPEKEAAAPSTSTVDGQIIIPRSDSGRADVLLEPDGWEGPSRTAYVHFNEPFEIEEVMSGEYRVTVEIGRAEPLRAHLFVPGDGRRVPLELRYSPAEPLAGRVVDITTRDPLGGARVILFNDDEPVVELRATVSDSNGQFRFDGLDLKNYVIGFDAPGYERDYWLGHVGNEHVDIGLFRATAP